METVYVEFFSVVNVLLHMVVQYPSGETIFWIYFENTGVSHCKRPKTVEMASCIGN